MALLFQVCAHVLAVATAITLPREAVQIQTGSAASAEAGADGPPDPEKSMEQVRLLMEAACAHTDDKECGFDAAAARIEQVRLWMEAAPQTLTVQLGGCATLLAIAGAHSEITSFGKQATTALLQAGIGEALSQGLLNAAAEEAARGQQAPGPASAMCYNGIDSLNVHNDYAKGKVLMSHAPLLWPAIMAFFRAFKGSPAANEGFCVFAGLFGTPQADLVASTEVAAGAIDFVLEYLEDESLKSDPAMFQRVFCALSDPVHESSGVVARAIVNHGGPLQGIPLMVRALRWAKDSGSTFHEPHGYGLLYEGVHDVGGILEHDDANRSFAKAFVQAGLVEELVPIMKKEPHDRQLQDMSCEVVKWVTDDNVAVQEQLAGMGILRLMANALKWHSHPPFHGYCPVTIACSTALLNFASTSEAWRQELRHLGVYDTLSLDVLLAFPPFRNSDLPARRKWFPNVNVHKLKWMLALPLATSKTTTTTMTTT